MKLNIPHRLTAGDARSVKAKKNIAITFLFKGGIMLINLALIPLTINFVSSTEYGVWITLTTLIAWFNLFDIGFGHGLRNKFAEAVAEDKTDLAKSYVSTTYAFLTIVIATLCLLFFIANHFVNWSWVLNVDQSLRDSLGRVALIIFTFFSLQFILKLVGTVFVANQEPAKNSAFNFVASFFILVAIYILTRTQKSGTLESLAWITGSFQVIVLIAASIWYYARDLKQYKPSLKSVNFAYLRPLMGLGGKFFVIQVSAIFVFESTNIIITQLLGPDQVTVYNIAYRYFTIPLAIAVIIASPLWSAFTDAHVRGDYPWMQNAQRQLLKMCIIIVLILVLFFFLSPFVYKFWIGDKIIIPTNVSLLMMLNIMANTVFTTLIVMVNGVGKIKLQLIIYIILGILFVPTAYICGQRMGLVGIVMVNVFVNSIFALFAFIQSKMIVENKTKGIWNR